MILRGKIKIIKPYSGKSIFDFFNKMESGDVFDVIFDMNQEVKGGSNGFYATQVRMKRRDGLGFTASITEWSRYLKKIEYEEIE